jgi:hypothetical protein
MYKHVDREGRVTYSNEPIPGGKRMDLDPLTTIQAPKIQPSAPPPAAARAETLAQELVAEREQLALARHALELEEQRPEVVQASEGGAAQATGRSDEKIRMLTEQVETRARRVESLERELAALPGRSAVQGEIR